MMAAVAQKVVTDLFFCNNIPTFIIEIDKAGLVSLMKLEDWME